MAERGTKVLIKIEDPNNPGSYLDLAAQTNAEINYRTNVIETNNKNQEDWEERIMGRRGVTISCDGLVVMGNAARTALLDAWENGNLVTARIVYSDASTKTFSASIELTETSPSEEAHTYSATFESAGAVT